jgi:hypothetical protein
MRNLMKWTTGHPTRTGAPVVGIGSSIVSTSATLFQSNTMRSRMDAFEALHTIARHNAPRFVQVEGHAPIPPVSFKVAREIREARPLNVALDKVMKSKRVRCDEVRSEGRCWLACCAAGGCSSRQPFLCRLNERLFANLSAAGRAFRRRFKNVIRHARI